MFLVYTFEALNYFNQLIINYEQNKMCPINIITSRKFYFLWYAQQQYEIYVALMYGLNFWYEKITYKINSEIISLWKSRKNSVSKNSLVKTVIKYWSRIKQLKGSGINKHTKKFLTAIKISKILYVF